MLPLRRAQFPRRSLPLITTNNSLPHQIIPNNPSILPLLDPSSLSLTQSLNLDNPIPPDTDIPRLALIPLPNFMNLERHLIPSQVKRLSLSIFEASCREVPVHVVWSVFVDKQKRSRTNEERAGASNNHHGINTSYFPTISGTVGSTPRVLLMKSQPKTWMSLISACSRDLGSL